MKKKAITGILITLGIVVLIGGFAMMKKTVKQESFNLAEITSIVLQAYSADVKITLTDEDKLTVTQYSMKKVSEDFAYTANTDGSALTIADNGKEVSWLFGIKGSAGISYELRIPKSYVQNLSVRLGSGNVEYTGGNNHKLEALNVEVAKRGDINLSNLWMLENSSIFTGGGNIDVSLVSGSGFMVSGESLSGNVTVDKSLQVGEIALKLKTNKGNITAK